MSNAGPSPDAFVAHCPSREILARLAEKWTMLVVAALSENDFRFGALRRKLDGVSQKMLTQTLRNLEEDGIVSRRVFDEGPLRVEYALTRLGRDLAPLIEAIKQWTERHMHAIEHARAEAARRRAAQP